jgi:hypothetical protein
VLWVRENRLAPLLTYVLIALSLVMLPVLREVPMAVLYGLFLFMGRVALTPGCQISYMEPHWLSSIEPCFDAQQ